MRPSAMHRIRAQKNFFSNWACSHLIKQSLPAIAIESAFCKIEFLGIKMPGIFDRDNKASNRFLSLSNLKKLVTNSKNLTHGSIIKQN